MALDLHNIDHRENPQEEEEDYIDMEISSISNLFFYPKSTSLEHPNEFEFQMFSSSSERETSSPADELFYKGKLLPLHLPPRLQMFEKLLQNSSPYGNNTQTFENEQFSTPLITTPIENTPFTSCNISPYESPKASKELNSDEYFAQYPQEAVNFMNENSKKSWAKKFKLGSKLKASHAYLKSLFNKSSSSGNSKIYNEFAPKTAKASIKSPFGEIQSDKYQMSKSFKTEKTVPSFKTEKTVPNGTMVHHRRSFSGAIRRFSKTKVLSLSSSSSSVESSSSSSGNSNDLSFPLKSGKSDIENSIQGAIAHCKRSQQEFRSRKTLSEVGNFYALSTSALIGCDVQDGSTLCRG